jgi:hypothetical protein
MFSDDKNSTFLNWMRDPPRSKNHLGSKVGSICLGMVSEHSKTISSYNIIFGAFVEDEGLRYFPWEKIKTSSDSCW